MTEVEIDGESKYLLFVDGYLPDNNVLATHLDGRLANAFVGGEKTKDDCFARALTDSLVNVYFGKVVEQSTESRTYGYPYIINPMASDQLSGRTNPLIEEALVLPLGARKDYRVLCMLSYDERHNETLMESFRESLRLMDFTNRADDTYGDLPRLKNYLHQVAEMISAPHISPESIVLRDLGRYGIHAVTSSRNS